MKLLVTGGAGFIGSNFVHYWQGAHPQDEIVVFDKFTYAGHLENLQDIPLVSNFHIFRGDICDANAVRDVMEGRDAVIHFAAESHVDRSIINPQEFLQTNVIGTGILLEAARDLGISIFHHVSTDEVYGSLPLDKPDLKFNEESPYNPHSPYSASKAASDHLVRAYHKTYGLPVTITNTSNNFGPWQDPEKLIPRFVTNLMDARKVPLMGEGENVRDWIHVIDHCRAIDMVVHGALEDEKLVGETFCVGADSERTNMEITKQILKLTGNDESMIEYIPHRLGHDSRYAIDSSKIRKVLGWQPQYSLEEWLGRTVSWYAKNRVWWEMLKEGRPVIDPSIQTELKAKRKGEYE